MGTVKYALVTGASRGIGRAVAIKLATRGFSVIINYASNDEAAMQTADEIARLGGKSELLPFDVSDCGMTADALQMWKSRHPDEYISVVVNNAGIRKDNLMMWMEESDWRSVLGISLDGFKLGELKVHHTLEGARITIVNTQGHVVYTGMVEEPYAVNLGFLGDGIYIAKVNEHTLKIKK